MTQGNSKYHIKENKLIIGDSQIIFDFPIKDSIEIGNMLIVLEDVE